jgi:predicted nucleic acid-binding protein
MVLILDASAALAWLVDRVDPAEARLADEVLRAIQSRDALVPALWFPELANGVLAAERRGGVANSTSASFMGMVHALPIEQDTARPSAALAAVLTLARAYQLTGYDATYLELVLRIGGELATFDRQLADAVRKAGGRVFGDAA